MSLWPGVGQRRSCTWGVDCIHTRERAHDRRETSAARSLPPVVGVLVKQNTCDRPMRFRSRSMCRVRGSEVHSRRYALSVLPVRVLLHHTLLPIGCDVWYTPLPRPGPLGASPSCYARNPSVVHEPHITWWHPSVGGRRKVGLHASLSTPSFARCIMQVMLYELAHHLDHGRGTANVYTMWHSETFDHGRSVPFVSDVAPPGKFVLYFALRPKLIHMLLGSWGWWPPAPGTGFVYRGWLASAFLSHYDHTSIRAHARLCSASVGEWLRMCSLYLRRRFAYPSSLIIGIATV